MLKVDELPEPPRRRAPPREDPPPEEVPESEQPTFQRVQRKPAAQRRPPADDSRTRMLDIRNLPSPEELRQQAAKAAAKSAGSEQAPASGWTLSKVAAILFLLAVVFGLVAVVLAIVFK